MRRFATIAMLALATATVVGADKGKGDGKQKKADDKTVAVSIKDMAFDPATVSVKVGGTVVWSNNDDRDHSVVAKDGSFKSGNISSGETYERTFAKAGKFAYACGYHPRMKGTVVVTGPADEKRAEKKK